MLRHTRSLLVARGISSLTRDGTQAPCIRSEELALGPPGKPVSLSFFTYFLFSFYNINMHVQCARHRNTMPNKNKQDPLHQRPTRRSSLTHIFTFQITFSYPKVREISQTNSEKRSNYLPQIQQFPSNTITFQN